MITNPPFDHRRTTYSKCYTKASLSLISTACMHVCQGKSMIFTSFVTFRCDGNLIQQMSYNKKITNKNVLNTSPVSVDFFKVSIILDADNLNSMIKNHCIYEKRF